MSAAGQRRHRHAGDHAEPGQEAEMHEERRAGIGAEPDIERMPERELPGEAGHDVPRLAEIGGEQHHHQHRDDIGVDQQRQHQHQRDEEAERRRDARRDVDRGASLSRAPQQALRPDQQHQDEQAEAEGALQGGLDEEARSASDTPTRMPPSSAPGMLPRPPRMTMMKASSV